MELVTLAQPVFVQVEGFVRKVTLVEARTESLNGGAGTRLSIYAVYSEHGCTLGRLTKGNEVLAVVDVKTGNVRATQTL